jgi:D-threo-aldose 1-dehydrogenase
MLDLPRLGMGTAALGNLYRAMDEDQAAATVDTALELGIRYYDTAPHYGFGLAEERLGSALAGRGDAIISTKVGRVLDPMVDPAPERHGFIHGRPFEPRFDYSRDGIRCAFEGSLARLRRSRVDILLAHDLGRQTHGERHEQRMRTFLDHGYRAMCDLRDEGLVAAIGIGVNEIAVCIELLGRVDLDVILLAGRHTLLDRSAERDLLPLCAAKGVKLIVGGPYNSGILARPLTAGGVRHFDYAPAGDAVMRQARSLEAMCDRFGIELPTAALQYPLRDPSVLSVVPGMASPLEVRQNVARIATPVPDAAWAAFESVDA